MARHSGFSGGGEEEWIYWLLGIAAAWYLYSSGVLTSLLSSFSSLSLPSTAVPATNAQGVPVTVATPGLTQIEAPAIYVNDVNVSSGDQYSQ